MVFAYDKPWINRHVGAGTCGYLLLILDVTQVHCIKLIQDEITANLGTICGDSSLKFKFLGAWNFLSVNFQLFTKVMILARQLFKLYHRRSTQSLITTSFKGSKNRGSMDLVH